MNICLKCKTGIEKLIHFKKVWVKYENTPVGVQPCILGLETGDKYNDIYLCIRCYCDLESNELQNLINKMKIQL